MRNRSVTLDYYIQFLGFTLDGDYGDYLILTKDNIEIHFFEFKTLDIAENYGQVYIRTQDIDSVYEEFIKRNIPIHSNGPLEPKPWGMREFSLLDPDHNLLTFGQDVE